MNRGNVQEIFITSENHSAQDEIPIAPHALQVTIKALPNSALDVTIGWNSKASTGNFLEPGDSATYGDYRVSLDGNRLYVGFSGTGSAGGKALISVIYDTGEPACQ